MVKYSSFLLIASLWVFIVLCVGAATVSSKAVKTGTDTDYFNGNIRTVLEELSNIDHSSNVLLKLFRDMENKYAGMLNKKKKEIHDSMTNGMEMEKKIQDISRTLKNSTMPLSTELQSELDDIEKNAATGLTKLKEMENVKDIDEMQKEFKKKYALIRGQLKDLSTLALPSVSTDAGKKKSKNGATVNEAKQKLIEIFKTMASLAFTANKHADTISNKVKIVSSALSMIRNDLIKLEQNQYHLLLSQKDHFKTDAVSLIHSSLAQCVFSIMFGSLFYI